MGRHMQHWGGLERTLGWAGAHTGVGWSAHWGGLERTRLGLLMGCGQAAPWGVQGCTWGLLHAKNGLVQGPLGCSWSTRPPGLVHVHRATLDT